jgi:hypothetical protein
MPRLVELSYDELFEVSSSRPGSSPGPIGAAGLAFFDGPRTASQQRADARSSERIRPLLSQLPGTVVDFGQV